MQLSKPPAGIQLNINHPLAQGLVGCWLMNEGSGLRANDLSGNNNHGTLTTFEPMSTTSGWTGGNTGTSLQFNGTSNYIKFPTFLTISKTKTFSVVISIYYKSGIRLLTHALSTNDRYGISLGQLTSGIYNGTSYFVKKSATMISNIWNQIINTFDGNLDFQLYLNTISQIGGFNPGTDDANFTLGVQAGIFYYRGFINYMYIYNRILSPQEVQQLYSQPYAMFSNPSEKARKYYR
jgi:hypothetical protein